MNPEEYLEKWEHLTKFGEIDLYEDEYGVQMLRHAPYYFITNHGRVFSLYGNSWRELSYCTKISKNAKCKGGSNQQLCVGLAVNGDALIVRISKLMRLYFPLRKFNPLNESCHVHHVEPYNPDRGTENNRLDNLEETGETIHLGLYAQLGGSVLTEKGLASKNEKRLLQNLCNTGDKPVMICSRIDEKTGAVQAAWGIELTLEQQESFARSMRQRDEELQVIEWLLKNQRGAENICVCRGALHLTEEHKEELYKEWRACNET